MHIQASSESCKTTHPPLSTPYNLLDEGLDPRRVRAQVERVLELYLNIEYFSLDGGAIIRRLIAEARDGAPPSTRDASPIQSEKDIALWKATIGRKLQRLSPAHRHVLVEAAQVHRQVRYLQNQSQNVDTVLASPVRLAQLSRKTRKPDAGDELRFLSGFIAASISDLKEQRNRLVRGGAYREAVLLFWMLIEQPGSRELAAVGGNDEQARADQQDYCLRN